MEDVRRKPMVWHEAAAAFREVLSDPGRTVRFAGMPALVMMVLYVILALTHPRPVDPALEEAWEAEVLPFHLIPMAFNAWFFIRMQVWWARWVLQADDGVGFLSPSLGRRELAYLGWMLAAMVSALPVLVFLLPSLRLLDGALVALGMEMPESVAGGLFVLVALPLVLIMMGIFGRLMVGVVPLAVGGAASFRLGWIATRGLSVRLTALSLLTVLPAFVTPLFSRLTDPVEIAASYVVSVGLYGVGWGAYAVMLARFYGLTLGRTRRQTVMVPSP
ncbi:hypothetical protein AZA_78932 [Nitrospirillum viridazoti Y2]|uniref:Uncharacterized protein n=1 Tax=Nitrospirillum amazonense TaxID=28077 RepID=A0A560HYD8_9PROT|nr:hypothetical protein AZA_78932 [Nitrospirillum amazonense Y2]TWB49920.1 hypothetical protein FBZ92_12422 [Nitrospirillum amazonense]